MRSLRDFFFVFVLNAFQSKLEMFDSNGNGAISPTAFWHGWEKNKRSTTKCLLLSVLRLAFSGASHFFETSLVRTPIPIINVAIKTLKFKGWWKWKQCGIFLFAVLVVVVVSSEMHFLIWCTILKNMRFEMHETVWLSIYDWLWRDYLQMLFIALHCVALNARQEIIACSDSPPPSAHYHFERSCLWFCIAIWQVVANS